MYLKLQIEDMASIPFSARSLPPYTEKSGLKEKAIESSRENYSRHVQRVNQVIKRWVETKFRANQPPQPPNWVETKEEGKELQDIEKLPQGAVVTKKNIHGEIVFPQK